MERRGVVNDVSPRLRQFAKGQRSAMTRAEALFWEQVRAGRLDGRKFKRQVPMAPYIVDFLCVADRLVIELDGPPHETEARRQLDAARDEWLTQQGFRVLRFGNDQVLGNCDQVIAVIKAALKEIPSPAPLCGAPSPAEGERVVAQVPQSR